jgi:serine protease SohB
VGPTDTLYDLLGFLGRAVIVFVTFAACVAFVFGRARVARVSEPYVRLKEISARWRHNIDSIQGGLMHPKARRRWGKDLAKSRAAETPPAQRVFVIDFKGDILASGVDTLREEITVVLGLFMQGDEVVIRLESAGGAVHGYGLASSQLARLRARSIPVTVCVDKVAASGGYMMAAVANRIVAAPFAILGSIGVVAPFANAHKLLGKLGLEYEDITAGKFKRPVSLLGPVTEEGKAKLQEQIDDTHVLFKRFVSDMRPALDIEKVATGEHWYGTRAVELGLADAIATSDDILLEKSRTARILEVVCDKPFRARERLLQMARVVLGHL